MNRQLASTRLSRAEIQELLREAQASASALKSPAVPDSHSSDGPSSLVVDPAGTPSLLSRGDGLFSSGEPGPKRPRILEVSAATSTTVLSSGGSLAAASPVEEPSASAPSAAGKRCITASDDCSLAVYPPSVYAGPSRRRSTVPARLRTPIPGLLLTASTTSENSEDVPIMSDLAFSTVVSKSFTQKKLVSLLLHLGASSRIVSRLSKTDAFVVLANVRGLVEEAENIDDTTCTWRSKYFEPSDCEFNRTLFPTYFNLPDDANYGDDDVAEGSASEAAGEAAVADADPSPSVQHSAPSDGATASFQAEEV